MNKSHDTDIIISEVKNEFKLFLIKRRELIHKLGAAYEKVVANHESICEEIKNVLRDEIAERLISARDIERYCPDKWKKKTKPKNDNLSFRPNEPRIIAINTEGANREEQTIVLDSSKAHTNCRTEGYSSYEPTATAKQVDIRIPDSSVNLAEKEKINEPDERIRKVYDIIDFELSVSFEELRYYMESIFKKNKGTGDVWIHGTLNIRTGKVISVLLGCLD